MQFYLSAECPHCDETMFKLVMSMIHHNHKPVVPVDMAEQTDWTCDGCNTTSAIGDISLEVIT